MKFTLLDHEVNFLSLLDKLIDETDVFENKVLLIDKKLDFINKLVELEKAHLENNLKMEQADNDYRLERRKQGDNSELESKKQDDDYRLKRRQQDDDYLLNARK